jgi:hypothetical protein
VDSQLIAATYKPQVNGTSKQLLCSCNKRITDMTMPSQTADSSQLLVQARKTFVGKNNLESQYESIRIQNRAIGNTSAIAENDLRKNSHCQYIVVYGDMVSLNFNREILTL